MFQLVLHILVSMYSLLRQMNQQTNYFLPLLIPYSAPSFPTNVAL